MLGPLFQHNAAHEMVSVSHETPKTDSKIARCVRTELTPFLISHIGTKERVTGPDLHISHRVQNKKA